MTLPPAGRTGDLHPALSLAMHRARGAVEYRKPLGHDDVALLVGRIDALEAGLRDVRDFVAADGDGYDGQDEVLAGAVETERLCRQVACQMKAENIQWRLDPNHILRLCDAVSSSAWLVGKQARDLRAMSAILAPLSPRLNAEIMRAVLVEIAAMPRRPDGDEASRGWNRAARYVATAAREALRVASYPPVYNDDAVTEALASYPDGARIVIRDYDGDVADTGLNVGLLTALLYRAEAWEQLTHRDEQPEEVLANVERLAGELVARCDEAGALPEQIRAAVAALDAALIIQDEKRRKGR